MKLFSVKISFLHPVLLPGYLEGESEEEVRKFIFEKGKEQNHLDLKILELYEVPYPNAAGQEQEDQERPVLN